MPSASTPMTNTQTATSGQNTPETYSETVPTSPTWRNFSIKNASGSEPQSCWIEKPA